MNNCYFKDLGRYFPYHILWEKYQDALWEIDCQQEYINELKEELNDYRQAFDELMDELTDYR